MHNIHNIACIISNNCKRYQIYTGAQFPYNKNIRANTIATILTNDIILPYKLYTNFVHCILVEFEKLHPECDGNDFNIYFIFLNIQKNV